MFFKHFTCKNQLPKWNIGRKWVKKNNLPELFPIPNADEKNINLDSTLRELSSARLNTDIARC